jgi:hypothetical protein
MEPKLLLLDEVMAGLISPEVEVIASLLAVVHAGGIALVVAEHLMRNYPPVRICGRTASGPCVRRPGNRPAGCAGCGRLSESWQGRNAAEEQQRPAAARPQ